MIPGVGIVADTINTVISVARRDWWGALLSLLAAIPILGLGAGAVKIGRKLRALIKTIRGAAHRAKPATLKRLSALMNLLADVASSLRCDPKAAARKLKEGLERIRQKFGRKAPKRVSPQVKQVGDQVKQFQGCASHHERGW